MIEIKDLLQKWSKALLSGEEKKESIRLIISKVIGVEIKKEEIALKGNSVYLDIKPIYKNEILLKQERISLELEEELGAKAPKNIR